MKSWLKTPIRRFLVLLTLGLVIAPGLSLSQASSTEVLPGSRAAGLESCVAETDDMRRNHMDYLFHKRDKTVYQGIRTEDFSLNECIACHAAKDDSGHYVPVNDKGQFCQTCHVRVATKLDCFECHRTTPESS
jgi:hypothetical protein